MYKRCLTNVFGKISLRVLQILNTFFFVSFVILIAHFSYMYVISSSVYSITTDMTIFIYRENV